jgi:hypothetical protein
MKLKMKKLIKITLIILIGSNISFGIGFPHGYAKKKKTEPIESNKRDYIKLHKKLAFWVNAAHYIFMKTTIK